jgi:hypothetical protein
LTVRLQATPFTLLAAPRRRLPTWLNNPDFGVIRPHTRQVFESVGGCRDAPVMHGARFWRPLVRLASKDFLLASQRVMTPTLKRLRSRSRISSRVTVFDGTTCEPEGLAFGQKIALAAQTRSTSRQQKKLLSRDFRSG